ncbi:homogentisate 1,2-dioxygenase [Streptomyces afghaniensis]|uniref:homogentisate 1,2-dioxygenase n=1 Tax=Streptomyces afghaniensis TaxID=66865 RepID=UPI0033B5BFD2
MSQYRSIHQVRQGRTPLQAHRDLDGLVEDELSREGFDGPTTLFYRHGDPQKFRTEGRFRNTTFHSTVLKTSDSASADGVPQRLFHNDDVSIWTSRRQESMPWLFRNVDGDEAWFVHEGSGTVESEYGALKFGVGDYVYIPKGATRRWVVEEPLNLFGIETYSGQPRFPHYSGMGRHAPFDPDLLRLPVLGEAVTEPGEYRVRVKYDGEYSDVVYQSHPFDVLGWKGDLYPFAFNIADWSVITSDSVHLPPSMHVFLTAPGVTMLNLLPRSAEKHPGAERAPFHHRNADYDEVSLIHGGSAFGLPLPPGLIDHSPQGIHHGWPQEVHDAVREAKDAYDRVEWEIIMIETRKPLRVDTSLDEVEKVHVQF